MKERHWTNLVESLRHAQCVLLLGTELPSVPKQPSGTPSSDSSSGADSRPTVTMLSALAAHLRTLLELEGRVPAGDSLAGIAQQYEDTPGFGPSSLRSEAVTFWRDCGLQPSDVHRALAKLPFKLILTTAQDQHFEDVLREQSKTPDSSRYHFRGDGRDNPGIRRPSSPQVPVVYHLFGDVLEPTSLVLSENDLLDFLMAISGNRPLPDTVKTALQHDGQSFLFIGFGIRDWYFRILLKVLVRALNLNRVGSAFALESLQNLEATDLQQTLLYYQRGTRIELLDIDLQTFVAQLSKRFEDAGGLIPDATAAGPRPRVFICHAHEDAGLAARLMASLASRNLDPWLDRESLEGGDHWEERIEAALEDTHFVVVLHSAALVRKSDSYVNREIELALKRGSRVRKPFAFLIPLDVDKVPRKEWVEELSRLESMPLYESNYNEHVSAIASRILRQFQLRTR